MRSVLAVFAALVLVGCGGSRPATGSSGPGTTDDALGRPLDGLLLRPDLHAIVDFQVRRSAD